MSSATVPVGHWSGGVRAWSMSLVHWSGPGDLGAWLYLQPHPPGNTLSNISWGTARPDVLFWHVTYGSLDLTGWSHPALMTLMSNIVQWPHPIVIFWLPCDLGWPSSKTFPSVLVLAPVSFTLVSFLALFLPCVMSCSCGSLFSSLHDQTKQEPCTS